MRQKMKQGIKFFRIPILLWAAAVFLEAFLFNFRHWESLTWEKEHITLYEWYVGEGLEQVEPNLFRIASESAEKPYVILLNINRELNNLHVSLTNESAQSPQEEAVNIRVKGADEGSSGYYVLSSRDILTSVPKSEYIRLRMSGDTSELLINIYGKVGDLIRVNDFSGNVRVPFFFSPLRLIGVFLLLLAAYALRTSSPAHRVRYLEKTWRGKLIIAAILCLLFAGNAVVCSKNLQSAQNEADYPYMRQYQLLARSMAAGEVSLSVEPPAYLAEMENPYDYRARLVMQEALKESGQDTSYLWDTAYYEGKYYVYFGVAPVILFFLPWYLITGQDLSVIPVIWLEGCLFMLGIFALMDALVRVWFPKTRYTVYLLLSFLVANASGVWIFLRNPAFYDVPILLGAACGVWGLYFWITSLKDKEPKLWRVALGSFLVALVAGCRPTQVMMLALAIPIFWPVIWESIKTWRSGGRLWSRAHVAAAASFCLPVLLVALPLMYYNYVRFGSISDFGALYNLTIQDMTRKGLVDVGRTVFGYFTTFFQPPFITGIFPYFQQVDVDVEYYGTFLAEAGFGGLFAVNWIMVLCIVPFLFKKLIKERRVYALSCLATVLALVIAFCDFQIGGMNPRYTMDYCVLMLFSCALLVLAGMEHAEGAYTVAWKWSWGVFLLLFVQSVSYNFLTIFTDVYTKLEVINPQWFYSARYLLEFWR